MKKKIIIITTITTTTKEYVKNEVMNHISCIKIFFPSKSLTRLFSTYDIISLGKKEKKRKKKGNTRILLHSSLLHQNLTHYYELPK